MSTVIIADKLKTVATGNAYDLNYGDNLIVNAGVGLSSAEFDQSAIDGDGMNDIVMNGLAIGYTAIELGEHSTLTVGKTGAVSGNVGILPGHANTIINNGSIYGDGTGLFAFYSDSFTFKNNGTISSAHAAVKIQADGTFSTTNNGLLKTDNPDSSFSYLSNHEYAIDHVTNNGTIIGTVFLGGSNDVFNNEHGRVDGYISGGSGHDRLIGGAYIDKLSGGLGNDTFYFKTKADSHAVDHIDDFAHGQDHIALSKSLFKLDPGETMADAFKDITHAKYDANDHILYNSTKGALYYDADGYGGAKPIAFAILDNHATGLAASDFLLV